VYVIEPNITDQIRFGHLLFLKLPSINWC